MCLTKNTDSRTFNVSLIVHVTIMTLYLIKNASFLPSGKAFFMLFSWQAGTGKTFLGKEIQRALEADGKRVYITTSTGIGGRQYNFGSTTVHK